MTYLKIKMTYLKTLHLKIQRGRDGIIQVWTDLIFFTVPYFHYGPSVAGMT